MVVLWHIDHKDKGSYLCTLSSLVLGIHPGHLCYLAISSSATPFSFCLQSSPSSGSIPVSQLFTSDGQSIGALASASVLQMNIQGWFPLRLTDLISLRSKGLSRVFPSTTVGKHQFFGVTGKTIVDYTDLCQQSDVSAFIVPLPTCSPCVLNNLEAHTPLISVCLIIALPNLLGYLYPS